MPINQGQRGLIMYDPKTKQTTTIDTCYTWGHVNIDDNDVLWSSFGPAGIEGWFDTRIWDKTHDEKQAQGWTAFVVDHNGNGKRDEYTEPNAPPTRRKIAVLNVQLYGDTPGFDGSVWGSVQGMPGGLLRLVPGAHPPETAISEFYEVPWNNPRAPVQGFAPRGMDVDSKGVVWTVLSSGHLASFDRSKCKVLNGPAATGQHCPEGWTLYPLPGRTTRTRLTAAARTRSTTTSSIASTCSASAGTCRWRPETCPRAARARGRQDHDAARAVSDGLLSPRGSTAASTTRTAGWKGKGVYTTIATRGAVPPGRRQGRDEQADQVPDASGPVGEVKDAPLIIADVPGVAGRREHSRRPGPPRTLKNPIAASVRIDRRRQAGLHTELRTLSRHQW
jgi:hypothetical protein